MYVGGMVALYVMSSLIVIRCMRAYAVDGVYEFVIFCVN